MTSDGVLVTGAGGLIGTAVCRALGAAGREVTALVGPPGHCPVQPVRATRHVYGDITDADLLRRILVGQSAVVHLAGPPSVAQSFRDPVECMRSHVVGTAAMLSAMSGAGIRRRVHISSAEVYGTTGPGGVVHENHPLAPRSPYGIAKLAAEQLMVKLTVEHGGEAVVLRPFSVYGPGSPPWSLVGTVLRQVQAGGAVSVADPSTVRDYCYVADVADAVVHALDCTLTRPVHVLNVASGIGVSVRELITAAGAALGRKVTVQRNSDDHPSGSYLPELVADVTGARQTLGWSASTPLVDGLRDTAAWLRVTA